MKIIPINLKTANAFVTEHHRHHKKCAGCKFCIGLQNENSELIGVAICGRPVSRYYDDGVTIEINRLCTLGDHNACSMLYSACRSYGANSQAAESLAKQLDTLNAQYEQGGGLIEDYAQRISNVAKLHPPWFYAAKLRNLLNAGNPVRFILNGGHINMFAMIESFQCYEKGGDAGTIYYSIQFKEYREISIKQIKIKKASGTAKKTASVNKTAARVNSKSTPKTHTVKKGDCLWNIAKKYLGSGSRYMEIFNLNKDKLKDPNKIKIGQVLKLPAK